MVLIDTKNKIKIKIMGWKESSPLTEDGEGNNHHQTVWFFFILKTKMRNIKQNLLSPSQIHLFVCFPSSELHICGIKYEIKMGYVFKIMTFFFFKNNISQKVIIYLSVLWCFILFFGLTEKFQCKEEILKGSGSTFLPLTVCPRQS